MNEADIGRDLENYLSRRKGGSSKLFSSINIFKKKKEDLPDIALGKVRALISGKGYPQEKNVSIQNGKPIPSQSNAPGAVKIEDKKRDSESGVFMQITPQPHQESTIENDAIELLKISKIIIDRLPLEEKSRLMDSKPYIELAKIAGLHSK